MPRCVLPGRYYLATARTVDRKYSAPPNRATRELFGYCLARVAEKCGFRILAYFFTANHLHVVFEDSSGEAPLLMKNLNWLLARCLNLMNGTKGPVFDRTATNLTQLGDLGSVVRAVIYVLTQAEHHQLLNDGLDYFGAMSKPRTMGIPQRFSKAPVFFNQSNDFEEIDLVVRMPRVLEDVGTTYPQYRTMIERLRSAESTRIIAEHRAAGRGFIGVQQLMQTELNDTPKSEGKHGGRVIVIVERPERYYEFYAEDRAFRQAYAEAMAEWVAGNREVEFPAGTWMMVRVHGVRVAPPP